jgi:valyl-tRNA synthetase
MPPPNVTGALHMGHAMFVTLQARPCAAPPFRALGLTLQRVPPPARLQDIMIRWARMNGKSALWIPGAWCADDACSCVRRG